MNKYELGTTVSLETVFRDLDGVLFDPTTVALKVVRPDGVTDVISVINNPSVGNYNGDYTTSVEGEHTYTWTGEVPAISFIDVQSNFFIVVNYDAADIDTLIPTLRMCMGDWTEPYRYTCYTDRFALFFVVKILMRRW